MTDEEALAYANLMGCTPYCYEIFYWYVRAPYLHAPPHPVETHWSLNIRNPCGEFFWRSAAEAARYVCEYYGITGDTHEDADTSQKIDVDQGAHAGA